MKETPKPCICFIGPMIGRRAGYVTTPAQILSDLFQQTGYPVISASDSLNRYERLFDMVRTIVLHREQIDIIFLNVYSGPSFVVEDIVSQLARRLGKRLIMFLHGGAMPDFIRHFPRWTRRVLGRADIIVAPSQFLVHAVKNSGFNARVIPNVIELSDYVYRLRSHIQPRLLWMRAFHPIYNPEMALRVLSRLRMKFPDATLVMAGQDKGLLAGMKRLAQKLGLEQAVRFPGFLDPPAKAKEYAAADIFINTNRIDNMPVAVLEACAMGLPVVSTNVGGVPDLLRDGETGLLVQDEDAEAMAKAIERLIADPSLTEQISTNARKLAEQSSWNNVRPQWENLFEELIAKLKKRKNEKERI